MLCAISHIPRKATRSWLTQLTSRFLPSEIDSCEAIGTLTQNERGIDEVILAGAVVRCHVGNILLAAFVASSSQNLPVSRGCRSSSTINHYASLLGRNSIVACRVLRLYTSIKKRCRRHCAFLVECRLGCSCQTVGRGPPASVISLVAFATLMAHHESEA